MIDKISLKFGSSPTTQSLNIEVTPITIFVGPNNSGKSKALREIENFTRTSIGQPSDVIISKITFTPYRKEDIEEQISEIEQSPNPGENIQPGNIIIGKVGAQENSVKRFQINKADVISEAQDPNSKRLWSYNQFLDLYTLRLDGTNRLTLLSEQTAGDLQKLPQNHLSHLFLNNEVRNEVRRIIKDAFGKYYVIDPTNIGILRVRLSDREPANEREEKGWETQSVDFHKNALEITLASDGIRAFSGIITTLLAGDPKITLIDEPEAFLHPSLSSKLGKEIGNSLRSSQKRLFAATHSANFLMGCIQSGAPLNIVRLTYKNGASTARILPKDKILHLMRHPLLRSTGVLNGLFYESVIITEADSDRAFYQEINERLLAFEPSKGIPNCLFLNAQNKQTIHEILRPLREMGIPCAAIVDVDVVKEGGTVWTNLLSSANVPSVTIQSTGISRAHIKSAFDTKGINFKTNGGVDVLDNSEKEACNNLFDQLDEYGIFAVRKGELESWLKPLGTTASHSPEWLIEIFEKLGEDPSSGTYVKPSTGDIWDFMFKIKTWFSNPTRKGTPE